MTIRILICGRASITRSALHLLLDSTDGIEVVGEVATGGDFLRLMRREQPEVVLLEMTPQQIDDIERAQQLVQHALYPAAGVIVLSDHASYEAAVALFRAGARGFLLKNDEVDDLLYGVRKVASGGSVLAPAMLSRVIDQLSALHPADDVDPLSALTDREREVLRLLASGLSNAEIADSLWVREATVKSHVSRMLGKLGLRDRVQATALAHRSGMVFGGDSPAKATGGLHPSTET